MDGSFGTTASVDERVRAIIARQAVVPLAEVTNNATPQSLGMDSLAVVETIFSIEEAFDISVPFNANDPAQGAFDISSVGAIVAAVESLIAAR